MTHREIQASLGVYALNAVDPAERAVVDRHLTDCEECRLEVMEHREVAARLSATERSAPPGTWTGIARNLNPANGVAKGNRLDAGADVVPIRRPWLRILTVAASIAVLGAAAITQTVRLDTATDALRAEEAQVAALNRQLPAPDLSGVATAAMGDPASRVVALGGQATDATAIVVVAPDGTGYLTESTLPTLPADRTYQLWVIVDGAVISAGILGQDPGVAPFHIDVEGLEGFAITEEALGGVVSSVNEPVVAWLDA